MLVLAPKLSQRTISGSLLKFLSKLQVDEEPAIRTNTTILLGNITSYLNDGVRGAGIMALCASSSYYDATEIATRILPNIVVLTIDPDNDVRLKAFQAVEQFLQLVKQFHEKTTGDATVAAGTGVSSLPGNASLLGWAMSSLTLKGKPSEQSTITSTSTSAPLSSTISNASSVADDTNIGQVRVNSRTDLADLSDNPPPASPTSTDGWGELDNGINGEHGTDDKDGWDDIEPLEEAKPSAALASIQAAQKRPVSAPKSQASNPRPKNTMRASKDDDDDSWGAPTAKSSKAVNEDDPWGAIAAPVPKSSSNPLKLKSSSSVDDDLWAAIAAPPPTAGNKPGRGGRGGKTAAPKLGAQRINRTASSGNVS